MKYTERSFVSGKLILANDHYVAIPCDCSELTALATDGVIPAGTIVPANDATAQGVLLNDVVVAENPNGTMVIHGFINSEKLGEAPAAEAEAALKGITFLPFAE